TDYCYGSHHRRLYQQDLPGDAPRVDVASENHLITAAVSEGARSIRTRPPSLNKPAMTLRSLNVREDTVQFVETVVVDHEPPLASGSLLDQDLGAQLVADVALQDRDVRVFSRRFALAAASGGGRIK